jgi:two-component system, cell cycle response regulator DivK
MTKGHAVIIDDNRPNSEVLAMLLDNEGISSTVIASPRNLTEALGEIGSISVIFLDLEIPNYDGFAILHDLKSEPRLSGTPVVAYTVHVSEVNEARDAGFDGFLGKPLDTLRFPEQLQRILNNEPVWDY